ncbi:MAG: ribosome-associated translation inhibitor RaiA [Bacteroidales bacterium]|nr:ribosome-associated translation inhibitor RaiA [Bacteroidales bacterium]
MTINISSVHFKTDQKLEEFINEKVEKLSKLYDGIISAEVTLKLENTEAPENKTADIRIMIRGNDAIASKTAKSFEEAVDVAVDALKKQLVKIKEKEQTKR